MPPLYPLTFRPIFKRYLWGGRRLGEVLGKPIGEGNDYAESWEIADHEHGQSIVTNGPLAGTSLHELVSTRGEELLGRHHAQSRFPLIFKLLDCQRDLSVQVHPNDAAAAKLTPPDLGKTEAWVVLDAQPSSRIYAGLKKGCDAAKMRAAIDEGHIERWLHWFEPRTGDCVFIPAGTVHALGAGLLVAEIQQASDTTYRLYDWGRVGPDGKPRPLHIEEALAVIDYEATEVMPCEAKATSHPAVESLVSCEKFLLSRSTLGSPATIEGSGTFNMLAVIDGEIVLSCAGVEVRLRKGQTVLLPASIDQTRLYPQPRAVTLEIQLPRPHCFGAGPEPVE